VRALPHKSIKHKTMKAILNVPKGSIYYELNGNTFEVDAILSGLVCLRIPHQGGFKTVDFTFKEVYIVDIQGVLQKAFDEFNWSGNGDYTKLRCYVQFHGFKVDIVYNEAQ